MTYEDEFAVPGSRPRVVHPEPSERPKRKPTWDAYPRTYRVNGADMELFPISALAKALDRVVETIYLWERKGILPKPQMRAPRKSNTPTPKAPGVVVQGHRLYSRPFIEGIIRIAAEEGIDKPGTRIEGTDFKERVRALFIETGG